MVCDDYFAENIERILLDKGVSDEHKRTLGDVIYMVNEKMCFGLYTDKNSGEARLMLRVDLNDFEVILNRYGARKMEFTGIAMKGFIFVGAEFFDNKFEVWLQQALNFNLKAKKSTKKIKSI